ncbi:MAG: hypothetical protein CML99_11005 [Rhodobiaceae bacterium]|nr:hypothetical protein [Rhodobiaceae bacterium]
MGLCSGGNKSQLIASTKPLMRQTVGQALINAAVIGVRLKNRWLRPSVFFVRRVPFVWVVEVFSFLSMIYSIFLRTFDAICVVLKSGVVVIWGVLMRKLKLLTGVALVAALVLETQVGMSALAGQVTGTGTRIENDVFQSSKQWGRGLSVPQSGQITRVMGGTYGFQIVGPNDEIVGDFLFPEQAVGFALPAGDYTIRPLVCRIHRHHHVEVTVEY